LVSEDDVLTIELLGHNHNKKFLTEYQVQQLNEEKLICRSIERRGKLICMNLLSKTQMSTNGTSSRHLYVHMGMTGRITTPERVPCFGHMGSKLVAPDEYPPRFSYLQFRSGSQMACFSDPRKFGYISLVETKTEFESLGPDALTEATDLPDDVWCNRSTCIKSVMLDQKKVVSGIGNWIADEVLYQAKLHPMQNYLTVEESKRVRACIKFVLETACRTSDTSSPYPDDWLFHKRWGKGKSAAQKDYHGRTITHIDAA